jgi:hypothetical protein
MENNGVDSAAIASRQRAHRSSVSNGSRLFAVAGLDGRTQSARRFRDIIDAVTSDLGGADLLSEGQRQLIRRAAALSIMCESVEADLVRDLPFDIANYLAGTNTFRRVIETLGLRRVPKDATTLRDYIGKTKLPVEIDANEN